MVKRKTLRRVKVKFGVDHELERIANIYLEGNKPAKGKKFKEAKPLPGMSKADWHVLTAAQLGIPKGKKASTLLGRAAGVSLSRGKRLASSGEGVAAKKAISVGDALIGAGQVAKPGADASLFDLIKKSKNSGKKDSVMITGATRVGRKVRQTDKWIGSTRKMLKTGKAAGGKGGSILGIAAMFASHLVGSNKKDRG